MEKDNQLTLAEIRKNAVDAQAYRACQLIQALSNLIEHKKIGPRLSRAIGDRQGL